MFSQIQPRFRQDSDFTGLSMCEDNGALNCGPHPPLTSIHNWQAASGVLRGLPNLPPTATSLLSFRNLLLKCHSLIRKAGIDKSCCECCSGGDGTVMVVKSSIHGVGSAVTVVAVRRWSSRVVFVMVVW